jgi:26S proteasome regulatory subunit N2
LVSSKAFRFQVVQVIADQLDVMLNDAEIAIGIKKSCAFSLANAHQVLRNSNPVANIVSNLLNGSDDDALLGLQLCFDLVESGDQTFVNSVSASLKATASEGESKNYEKAMHILVGGFSSELAISYLHKNSDSDPLVMENLKQALELRGSGRNSVLHNCAVLSHSYLNAGTTNDAFLRDNLEWMRKASNWYVLSTFRILISLQLN